ncbi:MAG: hypothetical protein JZU65_02605 [Chlorobium sp.]|nr:hypothetical protein [Chlorobium sp.]
MLTKTTNKIFLQEFELLFPAIIRLEYGEEYKMTASNFRSTLNIINLRLKLIDAEIVQESHAIKIFQNEGILPKEGYKRDGYFVFQSIQKCSEEYVAEDIEHSIAIRREEINFELKKNIDQLEMILRDKVILDSRWYGRAELELKRMVELHNIDRILLVEGIYTTRGFIFDEFKEMCENHIKRYNKYQNIFDSLPKPPPVVYQEPKRIGIFSKIFSFIF